MSPPVLFEKYLPGEVMQFENFLQECKATQVDARALLKDPDFQIWIADWISRRHATSNTPILQMCQEESCTD